MNAAVLDVGILFCFSFFIVNLALLGFKNGSVELRVVFLYVASLQASKQAWKTIMSPVLSFNSVLTIVSRSLIEPLFASLAWMWLDGNALPLVPL